MIVLLVTGTTGSGKTTFVRHLSTIGWRTLHTGSMVRSINPTLSDMSSVVAPPEYNELIHDSIRHTLLDASKQNTFPMVAIETVPRSKEQTTWIREIIDMDYVPIVVNMDADINIRRNRVRTRNINDATKQSVDDAKIQSEDVVIADALERCADMALPIIYIDTSKFIYTMSTECFACPLINQAYSLQQEKKAYKQSGINSIKALASHMATEIEELRAGLDSAEHHNVTEELVDILWFFVLICRMLNVSCDELMRRYRIKATINQHRIDSGTKPGMDI